MRYTKIPADTFQQIQMNAGIICTTFDPATGVASGQIGATSGGVQFTDSVSFVDMGDDIDNCPKNTKELKILDEHEVTMSGTLVAISPETAKLLAGAADASGNKITPRNDLLAEDFSTLWFVGDYSDANSDENGGFVAIKLINALNTGGFSLQTADKEKGTFDFEFTGHYSIANPDVVPYELYVKAGGGEPTPSILFNKHSITIVDGDTDTIVAKVVPAGTTINWSSGNTSVATVAEGVVTAEGEGNTIITGSITVDDVSYTDTCTVVVEEATT